MTRTCLGEFEQLLLFALARLGDRAYGVTVREEIERRTGRRVSPGAVYTALNRLEARGLVSSFFGEPTPERGGKRKRYYALEPRGIAALQRSHDALRSMSKGLSLKPAPSR